VESFSPDPNLIDHTGHYKLALEEPFLEVLANSPKEDHQQLIIEYAKLIKTPSGGYRPLPMALKFHQSTKRYRWALGGNRSSKSASLCAEVFWLATGTHPFHQVNTPNLGWYCTTTWDKVGDTLWEKLKKIIVGYETKVVWHNKGRDIPEMLHIKTINGWSKIVFKAYEQGREAFQAAAVRYIAMDEQFPRDVFIEATTRIGSGDSLDFMAAMTPIDSQPWLEERLLNLNLPTDDIFEFPLDDNRISCGGFLRDEEIDAMIENWPPEVRETRRKGKWGSYQGAIYQSFNRNIHVVDEEKEKELFFKEGVLPPRDVVGGIDWGGANPFTFTWAIRIPWLDDDWYCFDEYNWSFKERGGRRLEEHAKEILDRCNKWGITMSRIWADWDPTDAREIAEYGIITSGADKAVKSGIEYIQTLLYARPYLSNKYFPLGRPQLHIAARCKNLIREMGTYRWKEGTEKQDGADAVPLKKDDHQVDSARYCLYSDRHFIQFSDTAADEDQLIGRTKRVF